MLIKGREIAEKIYQKLTKRVEVLAQKGVIPCLVVILVGENPASKAYVAQKQQQAKYIKADVEILHYPESISTETLIAKIQELNADKNTHAILVQRPLPKHIDIEKIEKETDPQKDIDGFHPYSPFVLPLPLAVMKILEYIFEYSNKKASETLSEWLHNKRIVVMGKGPTGGKPIIEYLIQQGALPQVVDSKTQDADVLIKTADIVISAIGKPYIIKPKMLKEGVILIGVGLAKGADGKLHGDYEDEEVEGTAEFYTPTPGGVGPVNVAMLLENLITACENQTIH